MSAQTIDAALEAALAKAARSPADVRSEIAGVIAARAETLGIDEAQLLDRVSAGRASVIAAYVRELAGEPNEGKAAMLTAAAAAVVTLTTRSAAEHSVARRTLADLQPSDMHALVRIRDEKGHGSRFGNEYADGVARAQMWRASGSRDALACAGLVALDSNIQQGFAWPLHVTDRGLLCLEVLGAWLAEPAGEKK